MGEKNFAFKGVCRFYFETGTEGGYWAFQDERFTEPYAGIHILKDGDHLRIFSKDDPATIVWDDAIQLRPYDLFTEKAFGMWIHADQVKVNRETWAKWFFDNHPAELVTLESE